jgi:hypothetical protein
MITRQKSGLVIVGDMNVTGKLGGGNKQEIKEAANIAKAVVECYGEKGERTYSRLVSLRELLVEMEKLHRFIEIVGEEEEEAILAEREKELAEEERKEKLRQAIADELKESASGKNWAEMWEEDDNEED